MRRGFFMASCCHLCCSGYESLGHLFLQCPFASSLWSAISFAFGHRVRLDGSIVDLWLKALKARFSSQIYDFWKSAIVLACQVVWQICNRAVFDGIKPSSHNAIALVWRFVRESNDPISGTMNNSAVDLIVLKNLNLSGKPSKASRVIEVHWSFPPSGQLKINTDGAAFGSPGLARCAVVFRTSRGFVKGCFAIPLGIAFAFEAELAAAIHAILLA